jgi:hypothetical protein
VKNDRTGSEVRERHDAESDRWPKKQDSPWPKDRAHKHENRRSRCVIRTDTATHDNWLRMRRVAKEIETISGQNKTAHDVDQVMLIREDWGQRDQNEPAHDRNASETARVAKINVEKN